MSECDKSVKYIRLRDILIFIYLHLSNLIKRQLCLPFISMYLNFLISVNCATGNNTYSYSHVCLNPFVISMLIREVFHIKRTIDLHIEIYTNTSVQSWTCGLMTSPARNCFHFNENAEASNYSYHYLFI